ncbi:hypothetical protein DM01DRAFT_1339840 [Hesseltinella vesiculosa]|uniref:Secreted protein n=1 Tax=Hesseltinella vesiculosa TaxID=101127 RepID=A0A1X2G5X4_9FUNG|nr:hypothetical protein DM01DRAFT_1339840 [Hesseltinella vesiculosa]
MQLTKVLAIVPLFLAAVHGQMVAQVVDANNFCVFLPPDSVANRNIADSEWQAQSFCMGNTPNAKGANNLYSGFIQSAHYVATNTYVQVTGQIDPTKAKLNATDDGGQMDVAAPKGSSCAGWLFYVNMIEPATNTFCMRCCNDKVTCNRGISQKGCAHVIPGDYSGPMQLGGSVPPPANANPTPSVIKSVSPASSGAANAASASSNPSGASGSSSGSANANAGSNGNVSAQSVNAAAGVVPTLAVTIVALVFTLLSQ